MEILLTRDKQLAQRTTGQLSIEGRWECFTMEDVVRADPNPATPHNEAKVKGETAIPAGRYRLGLRHSPKFGADTIWVLDVPGYEYILFHAGNTEKNTEGCILVGTTRTETAIGSSRVALGALKSKVVPEILSGREVWLTIA